MKIGIDGRPLQGRHTGIGRYVAELCKRLDSLLPQAEFIIYSNKNIEFELPSSNWSIKKDPLSFSNFLPTVLWVKLREGILASKDNVDIFWGAGVFLPYFLSKKIKKIITVYDLNHKIVPETVKGLHCWSFKLFFSSAVKSADSIFAISEGSSNRLQKYYNRKADLIVRPSVDPKFFSYSKEMLDIKLQEIGVKKPYLLAVGTLEPRKNLLLLLESFLSLKNSGQLQNRTLVLVGGKGWKVPEITSKLSEDNIDQIVSLGYVENSYLPYLYAGSDTFIFPSLYEGFGMPVLEALCCGATVVASDVPEIKEAGGIENSITYIEPTLSGISDGILKAISEPKSQKKLSYTSWEEGASKLSKLFTDHYEKNV